MAAELSVDSLLLFLRRGGGSVRNADLLEHFGHFLREHPERERNRELFKRLVNSVAKVREVDGVKFINLKREFAGDRSRGPGTPVPAAPPPDQHPGRASPNPTRSPHPTRGRDYPFPGAADRKCLPTAGVVLTASRPVTVSPPNPREPLGAQHPKDRGHVQKTSPKLQAPNSPRGPHSAPPEPAREIHSRLRAEPQQTPNIPEEPFRRNRRNRQSYKTAMSQDDDEEENEMPSLWISGAGPTSAPSAPLLQHQPHPSFAVNAPARVFLRPTDGLISCPPRAPLPQQPSQDHRLRAVGAAPLRQGFPQGPERAGPLLGQNQNWMSDEGAGRYQQWDQNCRRSPGPLQKLPGASRSGLVPQELKADDLKFASRRSEPFPPPSQRPPLGPVDPASFGRPPVRNFSAGNLCEKAPSTEDLPPRPQPRQMLQELSRSQQTWSFSTGDLCDNSEDAYSSEGSTSTPPLLRAPSSRRMDSLMRKRLCHSVGTDLDQLQDADHRGGQVARMIRLQRISSSLSLCRNLSSSSVLSCDTPPRSQSPMQLGEAAEGRSTPTHTHHHQSPVPLEPREHVWMVKAAAGSWSDVYALLREDSSLLNRRDFISGFTVLHWIAKHGDYRALNTIKVAASKVGSSLDMNAKSLAGYTPLHIAAIHNNKNILTLLVKNYGADVRQRDLSGRRPWQYLSNPHQELLELLGAPQVTAAAQERRRGEDPDGPPPEKLQQHHQRRGLRHHASSVAPGDRPLSLMGMTKVKRSSSLAIFLKHKRFSHQPDSSA